MPFQNTLICPALFRRKMRSFFFYVCHPYKIFLFFENICEYYQGFSYARSTVFFHYRLSYALSKYPNFPALLRGEKRSFFFYVSHLYKIFLFFENICEYYQGSSNALSKIVFLSSAEKSDFFFYICHLYKIFLFLRTYVNIFKVLAMRHSFCFAKDFLMP